MKLENVETLYFVISVFVPGFIYNGVFSNFVPLRRTKEKELLILRLLTATAVNYAICSPILYLLIMGNLFASRPLMQAIAWLAVIFLVPILLGLVHAWIVQRDGIGGLYRLLGLRAINPIPTGWDWIFSRTDPCFVLITLNDGTTIAGFFGLRSMASSDPEHKDIYIEKVYTVPEDGPWNEVENSQGMQVDGAQIAFIEFRGAGNG